MLSHVAIQPGLSLLMETTTFFLTPVEAGAGVFEISELVNEQVSTNLAFNRASMNLRNVSL